MAVFKISKNAGSAVVRTVLAVIFVLFTLTYLYSYQADTLAALQHVLSNGATHYNRTVGAVLITLVLMLLQTGIGAVTPYRVQTWFMTYVPSAVLLAAVTGAQVVSATQIDWGPWPWLAPLLLVVWGALTAVAVKLPFREIISAGQLTGTLWVNAGMVVLMALFTGLCGNSNDVFHYRMRAENMIMAGRYADALKTGDRSLHTDKSLTMLRAYALASEGLLGEKFFTYPVTGRSSDLLPMYSGGEAACIMLPTDTIYKSLGARPLYRQDTRTYLNTLLKLRKARPMVADYLLTGCLVDRDLDTFARMLPRFYKINDRLPRHYREALILYTHLRSNPAVVYHNEVMDTDFEDMQDLEKKYPDEKSRRMAVFDQYGGTYWWYYESDRQNL